MNCGQNLQSYAPRQMQQIPNYLVQAILVTIFWCMPFGIVAIVFAAQVNDKIRVGDVQGAIAASQNARMWSWVSFGVSGALILLYMLIVGVGAIASSH